MDNLDKIKFKEAEAPGWYYKIDIETGNKISFADGRGSGAGLYKEMENWVDAGGKIDPKYTSEELTEKEAREKVNLHNSFMDERKRRLIEADKWELSSILILIDKTIEEVIEYKELLRGMNEILTIDSDISMLESPPWPEKLTDKEFL